MSAAQLHLLSVHVPVVGCWFVLALWLLALAWRSDPLCKVGLGFLLVCAAAGFAAYASGPFAYDELQDRYVLERAYVERHALWGQGAFMGLMLTAVLSLPLALGFLRGETPPAWQRWLLAAALLAECCVLAWTAHGGGEIRHPEIRF